MSGKQCTVKTKDLTAAQQQQTQDHLTFEKAIQRARQPGAPVQLPVWQGPPDGQQAFIDKLVKNGPAKKSFNERCKTRLGETHADEKVGNTNRPQAAHPPQVAITVAVKVYNEKLEYYNANNYNLRLSSYDKACKDRDLYKQQRDEALQEREEAIQQKDEAIQQTIKAEKERDQAIKNEKESQDKIHDLEDKLHDLQKLVDKLKLQLKELEPGDKLND
ncbi:Hypp5026 [Branchiostoma lanceolatum]|uniref:Hypp5026 protein n=1 Tax=Branchiostoma lanceolatum TaxID=7740 RepID=A0A8K0ACH2_BRALA|nr:Hypp5026 [Branchiostoma lanceolatum]